MLARHGPERQSSKVFDARGLGSLRCLWVASRSAKSAGPYLGGSSCNRPQRPNPTPCCRRGRPEGWPKALCVLRGAPGQASIVAEVQISLSYGFRYSCRCSGPHKGDPSRRPGASLPPTAAGTMPGAERRPCWSRLIAFSRADVAERDQRKSENIQNFGYLIAKAASKWPSVLHALGALGIVVVVRDVGPRQVVCNDAADAAHVFRHLRERAHHKDQHPVPVVPLLSAATICPSGFVSVPLT